MIIKKLTNKYVIGPVVGLLIGAGILVGCTGDSQSETRSGESAGEHGSGGEGGSEHGAEGGGGGEEGSAAMLAPDETFDAVRGGARLIMGYDPAANAFTGTVANTTDNTLTRVRIEVHLDNGTELGPTTPVDLAPGEVMAVNLPSTQASFTGWVAHAEVGSGEGGGESGAEGAEGSGSEGGAEGAGGEGHGPGAEGGTEGGSGVELNEAAMSSPVIPLDQAWDGTLGPLSVSAWYDQATQTVHSTVTNTSNQTQCYVQAEPHLKSGTTTVGELGPDKLGDLAPGETVTSSVALATEPALAGVAFDGYVVHMEVFDCAGPGPQPHTSEGGEGGGGEGAGGEGHGAGGEGGSEGGTEGAEGGGAGGEGSGEHGSRGEGGSEGGGS